MKKSLILLLTLIMMISLVIISCNPDSSSGQAAVKEETFTEDTYKSIQKDNENAISTLGGLVSKFDKDNLPSKVSGKVEMKSTEGFSLVTEDDLNPTNTEGAADQGSNNGDEEESKKAQPNVYDYVGVAVEYTVSGKKATVTFEYHLLKKAEVATGTGSNNNQQGATTEEANKNTEIKWSELKGKSSSDQFAKEVLLLISKSVNKEEGSDVDISKLSFDEYLALVIGVGNATPEMTVSVTVEQDSNSATVAIGNVKIGGDISKKAVTLGGKISLTSVEGDTKTNIVSLGGNVSLTLSDDFKISLEKDSDGNLKEPEGSIDFAVSDIELICGDNAIVVNGKIQDGHIGADYGGYAKFYFSEKVGEEVLIVTEFTFNTKLSDGEDLLDWFEFNNFVYKGVSYSGESVKAVLKKVLESNQTE